MHPYPHLSSAVDSEVDKHLPLSFIHFDNGRLESKVEMSDFVTDPYQVPDVPSSDAAATATSPTNRPHHRTGLVRVKRFNEAVLRRASSAFSSQPQFGRIMSKLRNCSASVREFVAELIGTFLLMFLGNGISASLVLNRASPVLTMAISPLGWGFSLIVALYCCGGVSGGHLNPAVTIGFATLGKLPWIKTLYYMAGQYLGAFLASAVLLGVYSDAITSFDGGTRAILPSENATAQIFACYPNPNVSVLTCFVDQIVATAILLIAVSGISDERNMQVPKGLQPIAIAFSLAAIITGLSYNCGAPLNPARDLSPRILTAMAGWGSGVFSHHSYWFWVPIVGPHIGAILGAWLYKISVEIHWTRDEQSFEFWKNGSVGSLSNDIAEREKKKKFSPTSTESRTDLYQNN